ncbi:MAG TPA: hypothetical protein ENN86_05030 [Desulfobacteraceae bacterium]|nr:hypothetical protein [Desulfobacteraceae bacterium]
MAFLKRVLFWGLLVTVLYVLLGYHFIYIGSRNFKILKKTRLTLNYTFFSVALRTNEGILAVDELRKAGIADLLVDVGLMSEEARDRILEKYEEEDSETKEQN